MQSILAENLTKAYKSQEQKKDKTKDQIQFDIFKLFVQQIDYPGFEQNLQELQQKLGFYKIKYQQQAQKDFKRYLQVLLEYPRTSLAQLHRDSHRLGNLDFQIIKGLGNQKQSQKQQKVGSKIVQELKCSCCGLLLHQQQLSMSTSMKDIACLGISTYMLFRTMKNVIYLLLLALVVFGVFAFATNIKCADTWSEQQKGFTFNNVIKVSLNPKIYLAINQSGFYDDLLICQLWLGVTLVVLNMGIFLHTQYIKKTHISEMDNNYVSASDFSIVVRNVPADIKISQVQHEINKLMGISNKEQETKNSAQGKKQNVRKPFQIVKINVATPQSISSSISQQLKRSLITLYQENQRYKQKIVEYIMQLRTNDSFIIHSEIRKKTQDEYIQNKRKIKEKKQDIASKRLKDFLKSQSDETLTDCYVTFQSNLEKDKVLDAIQYNFFLKALRYLSLFIYQGDVKMKFKRDNKSYPVKIQNAQQPEDIIWENAGIKTVNLFGKKCITFLVTLIVLGMSFAAVYGLSTIQVSQQSNRYVSFLISLSIAIFNHIIKFVLKFLTMYEFNSTQTQYQSSYAIKVIWAKLINTILILILVNRFLKKPVYFYSTSGLSQDVYYLSLTLSFLNPLLVIFDPWYFFIKYLRVWYYDRPEKKFFLKQKQLNRIYELVLYETGQEYIYVISLYLWTCFFMSLQPIIILFSIFGFILNYWAQKYSLLHRSKRPIPGTKILYDTMVQFVHAGGFYYSVGSLTFVNLLPQDLFGKELRFALIANLVAVGLSAISLVIPYAYLSSLFLSSQSKKEKPYSTSKMLLQSDYDRLNPATSKNALKEHFKLLFQTKSKLGNKKLSPSEQDEFERNYLILQDQSRNNYLQSFEQMNPFNFFSQGYGRQFDELQNPQIDIIPAHKILNYVYSDLIDQNRTEKKSEMNEKQKQKQNESFMSKVKNFFSRRGQNKPQVSGNLQLQQSQQRISDKDKDKVLGKGKTELSSFYNTKNIQEKNPQHQNDIDFIKFCLDNADNEALKNSLPENGISYSSSPYNPPILQLFQRISYDAELKKPTHNKKSFFEALGTIIQEDNNQVRRENDSDNTQR